MRKAQWAKRKVEEAGAAMRSTDTNERRWIVRWMGGWCVLWCWGRKAVPMLVPTEMERLARGGAGGGVDLCCRGRANRVPAVGGPAPSGLRAGGNSGSRKYYEARRRS